MLTTPQLLPEGRYFEKIASGVHVAGAVRDLAAHPRLWNEHTERTRDPRSPNYGCDDIWLRFRAREQLTCPADFREAHYPVFYPAWHKLPAVQAIVWDIVALARPVMLGGILVTRVPPDRQIKMHDDRGAWNAEFMNFKVWIPLRTNPRVICRFPIVKADLVMKAGDVWSVDNMVDHSVENYGEDERVTLIITMRVER